jgi:glutamine cyclotransferase
MSQQQTPNFLQKRGVMVALLLGAGVLILIGALSLSRPTSQPTPESASATATPEPASLAEVVSPPPTPTVISTATPELATVAEAISPPPLPTEPPVPIYTYQIINVYPHDRGAFTQGLVFTDGILYEGTGLNGQSTLRKVELETGEILQSYELPADYFGEGIAIFDNQLIQLTFQTRIGFVYDKESFDQIGEFSYPTEGWGLTQDGTRLIMGDGSATLYFRDPETLEETGQVTVFDANGPVTQINELEYINGEIYANIWRTERLARINPDTGQVTAWIDLSGLLTPEERSGTDVLNGIAYDAENDRLFVTGKWWPKLFEIDIVLPTK